MSNPVRFKHALGHRETRALLPWYVNGTLRKADREQVDAHLSGCSACRDELSQEQRICERMAADTGLEFMPVASFKRLQSRLDQSAAVPTAVRATVNVPAQRSAHHSMRRYGLIAASVAIMAMAGLVGADRWIELRARRSPPTYRTVTASEPRSPQEVIRAVFSPDITLVDLQAILGEAQLRIISGPTEAGVYSLAPNSNRPVSSSLALLRRHAGVRFAESTRLDLNRSGVT